MTSKNRKFAQVDVFSTTPYFGNPVAVVLDADGLTDAQMLQLANWTNLSETTFLLPATDPAADYRLRIFTPGGELPFAGHPTLGSAHAWLENGGVPKSSGQLVQECAAGLVTLKLNTDTSLSFQAPPTLKSGDLEPDHLAKLVAALGIEAAQVVAHQSVDNGPGWVVIQLASAAEVLALEPDFTNVADGMVGVIGAYPQGSEVDYEIRGFAPRIGVFEDPVTGSLNASVAQWLVRTGAVKLGYTASQGTKLGRAGRIQISVDESGSVWVGGATVTCIRGEITI